MFLSQLDQREAVAADTHLEPWIPAIAPWRTSGDKLGVGNQLDRSAFHRDPG